MSKQLKLGQVARAELVLVRDFQPTSKKQENFGVISTVSTSSMYIYIGVRTSTFSTLELGRATDTHALFLLFFFLLIFLAFLFCIFFIFSR